MVFSVSSKRAKKSSSIAAFNSHTAADLATSTSVRPGGQNVEISSEIPNPSNLRGDKKKRGINLKGTEEGAVELADGEAEAGLREASVGEAAAAAAGERSDAVRAAAAAADNEVLEGERGANVAGGVGGHRADAGRHRGSLDQFTVRCRPGRTESATD